TFANKVSSLPMPTFTPGLIFVPRCRTMIDPPGTNCPPNAFTPNRCELESRPFLELPKPFLCAMTQSLRDLVNLHARIILPVPLRPPVLLLALELEDDSLSVPVMFGNRAPDHSPSRRRARSHVALVDHRQHPVKLHLRPDLTGQGFQLHRLTRSNPVLLPTVFNHCVHTNSLSL